MFGGLPACPLEVTEMPGVRSRQPRIKATNSTGRETINVISYRLPWPHAGRLLRFARYELLALNARVEMAQTRRDARGLVSAAMAPLAFDLGELASQADRLDRAPQESR